MKAPALRIAITGPDGSGKSTACAAVRERLERAMGPGSVAEVSVWDCLRERPAPFGSKSEASAYLVDLDGVSRTLFIFHALSRALQLAERSGARVLLLNGYWYKYAVSELGYGVPEGWVLGVARGFPAADRVFCLDVSPETAWERRRAATDYEQGAARGGRAPGQAASPGDDAAAERFIAFQRKLRAAWTEVERLAGPWEHVSAELPPEEVARELSARIADLAQGRGKP